MATHIKHWIKEIQDHIDFLDAYEAENWWRRRFLSVSLVYDYREHHMEDLLRLTALSKLGDITHVNRFGRMGYYTYSLSLIEERQKFRVKYIRRSMLVELYDFLLYLSQGFYGNIASGVYYYYHRKLTVKEKRITLCLMVFLALQLVPGNLIS